MRFKDSIELKTNITFTLRDERGKLTERRSHNVWLDYGRDWLLHIMSYDLTSPPPAHPHSVPITPAPSYRIFAMGFGIGGTKQIATLPPILDTVYPGTNAQTDTDLTVTYLERPVCVEEKAGPTYYWLQGIDIPATTFNIPPATPYYVKYLCNFGANDITYGLFGAVPLSEIGLFDYGQTSGLDPQPIGNVYALHPIGRPQPVAYDTFYSITKTTGVTIQVEWEIRL